jgi:hypothetical protein
LEGRHHHFKEKYLRSKLEKDGRVAEQHPAIYPTEHELN